LCAICYPVGKKEWLGINARVRPVTVKNVANISLTDVLVITAGANEPI